MDHPSYVLQMGGYDTYEDHKYNQMGQMGFLNDLKSWGQGLINEYIDEPLRELGDTVGLSKEEIDRIASETNKAYQQELVKKQQELAQSIVGGSKTPTSEQSTIAQLQNQISNLTSQLDKSVPGGMTTVYAVGGLLGGFVLYKIFAGPK